MKNFVSNGNSIQLTAPVGGVLGSQPYVVGQLVGVIVADAPEGEKFTMKLTGEYLDLPKKTGESWAIGDKVYCKNDNTEITKTNGAGYTFIGYATAVQINADTKGSVLLAN